MLGFNLRSDIGTDDDGADSAMPFYVFMLVFWPTALVLGLLAFCLLPGHDLRLPTLGLAVLAGWAGMNHYRNREQGRGRAT